MLQTNTITTISDAHLQGVPQLRLDKILALLFPDFSRAAMKQLIVSGHVQVDDAVCSSPRQMIRAGAVIAADLSAATARLEGDECEPEAMSLDIIFEDESLLIINKPAGIVSHPAHHHRSGTLQAGVLHHHPDAAGLVRGGLVHRLDKDTSGLLVVAKTAKAQKHLINQFKNRDIGRHYYAIVFGAPPRTGIIDAAIDRNRHQPTKMAVQRLGKRAVTRFFVVQQWHGFSLLQCELETGRTHQIRLHLEHYGFPIVGDPVYRTRARAHPLPAHRQMLHAKQLHLIHPTQQTAMHWDSPLPADMQAAIDYLNENNAKSCP